MTIKFHNAIYPVDSLCGLAFITMLNMLLLCPNIVELNKCLIFRDTLYPGIRLSGYFQWEFTQETFIVRQRLGYGTRGCFPGKILDIHYRHMIKPIHPGD